VWIWDEALLALRRSWAPTPDFATLLATNMAWLIVYGRVLSALVGTVTVAVVYRLGRRHGGELIGALAALIVATNLLQVRDSHALKTETFHTLGTLLTMAALATWILTSRLRPALAAGVAIGLTTAFRYTAVVLIVPAWLADVHRRAGAGVRRFVPSGALLGIGAVAALVFFLGSPFLVLDYANVRREAALYGKVVYETREQDVRPAGILATVGWLVRTRSFGHHVTVSLRRGCGLAMALATPVAVIVGLRSADPLLWLAAAYAIVHYLVTGASPLQLSRYFTPLVPLLALLVAHTVAGATARLRPRPRMVARLALTVLLVAEPLYGSIAYDRIASETDTRVLATQWMAEHLPRGARVARFGSFIFPLADPDLPPGVELADREWGDTDLDAHGVTHVVTHQHTLPFSQIVPQQWRVIAPRLRLLAEFSPYRNRAGGGFERLDAYYVPLWDFAAITRPGPLVRVWAVEPAPR
ncbi:MAG: ArnT family glycosyltransferase, partial [Candidatus Binatia bacterium]